MPVATSSKRCGWRGTSNSSGRSGLACTASLQARSKGPSSPSRVLAARTTARPRLARHARPSASLPGSGVRSYFRWPITCTCRAPARRKRSTSASDWASTDARLATAGRISASKRRPLARLRSERRALASTIGTPWTCAACSKAGQTSVSISTPTAGRCACRKRRTAPGVSQGSQACASPSRSSELPAARPVAVPWVSSRRSVGSCARKAAIKGAAAWVSPSDTACSHSRPGCGAPVGQPSRSAQCARYSGSRRPRHHSRAK